jgi:hypothetical protein
VRKILIVAMTTMLGIWAGACGSETQPGTPSAEQLEVTGIVLDVAAGSLTQIETLSVQDDTGVKWDFEAEDYKGWLPSHVRDHMVQGSPIIVTYHEEAGLLVVDEIEDARSGD